MVWTELTGGRNDASRSAEEITHDQEQRKRTKVKREPNLMSKYLLNIHSDNTVQ